ncbi:hypothetical protein Dimus_020427 [Dionaea muscipula]
MGENVVGEKEGDEEGDKLEKAGDEGLRVRKRRRLRKATSVPVAETEDSEETESVEDVRKLAADSDVNMEDQTKKRCQKQAVRTGPAAKKAKTDRGKIPLVEEEIEPIKEPDVSGSPTIAELDQKLDELLAHPLISEEIGEGDKGGQRDMEEVLQMGEEEGEEQEGGDVSPSTFEGRRRRKSLFTPQRLSVPSSRPVRRCMDVMMGCVNRATIRSFRSLPLKHKSAILCRNMAEKYALEKEVKELKFECDSAFEISSQVKANIDLVIEENQTLESKNEGLKSSLEEEKGRVQTLEEKVKEL